jgi:hypothetical protein
VLAERPIQARSPTHAVACEALPAWLERALRVALYALVAFALTGMPLAMAGGFRPLPVALLTMAGTGLLVWATRDSLAAAATGAGAAGRPRAWTWTALGALLLAAVWTAFAARWSSQHLLADRDPGVYMWHGRWIARSGSLLVDSPRALFEPLLGPLSRHCPTSCPGAPGGRLYVQFLHLFPLTLAVAQWLGGPARMVKANALIGGFSLVCFYAVATRLVRPWLALAATAALAVDVVQVHFARDSVSEVLAQALLFGGLYLLWQARRRFDPAGGLVAGLAIGATCMVRIDSFFYLIPLALYLFGELAVARGRGRFVAAVATGLTAAAALGFADLWFFSRAYFHFESEELRAIGAGLAATLAAGAALLALLRHRGELRRLAARTGPRLAAIAPLAIVVLALFAAFVRPHVEKAPLAHPSAQTDGIIAQKQRDQGLAVEPRRGYGEHSFVWLDWYLGPVALAAGVGGLALLSRELLLGRAGPAAPFLGVFLGTSLLYLWRPSIFPDQIWAMRRFLPVAIPGFVLMAAFAAERLLAIERPRRLGAALAVLIAAGTIAVPLAELVPLREERQQAGALGLIQGVCRSLPPHAAVIVVKSPNYNDLVQPLHSFCGVPVAQLYRGVPHSRFVTWAPRLRRRGYRLVLLSTNRGAMQVLLGSRAPRRPFARIDYRTLEQRLAARPRRQIAASFRVYRAMPRGG